MVLGTLAAIVGGKTLGQNDGGKTMKAGRQNDTGQNDGAGRWAGSVLGGDQFVVEDACNP